MVLVPRKIFRHRIFILIITKFDRLKSLKIVLFDVISRTDQFKLQVLLARLSHLHSFTYFSWSMKNIFPFELKNTSIRQVDIRGANLFYNHQQCQQFIHSSIGQQCEILWINLEQHIDILDLIQQIRNLRVLIVKCRRVKENENLIQCLEQSLPSTCAISNSFETNDNEVRLWIG